jgi:hypothetical protein
MTRKPRAEIELLKRTIAADPFPLSPLIRKPRAILDKLEPAPPRPEQLPAPKPVGEPSMALAKKNGARDIRRFIYSLRAG